MKSTDISLDRQASSALMKLVGQAKYPFIYIYIYTANITLTHIYIYIYTSHPIDAITFIK